MLFRALAAISIVAAVLPATASARWREASTKHFVIYSEEGEKVLREYAEKLERFDGAMRYVRGLPDIDPGRANRLTVYVVRNIDAVQKLAGAKENSLAGFYIPRASGSIAIVPRRLGGGFDENDNAETVLMHEYGHHFMFQNYPKAYPAWFVEGFAEFHSTAKLERDGSVGIGLPAMHRAYGLMSGNPLPVEELLTVDAGEKMSAVEREAIYGRGWLLTHYLTFEKSRDGQLSAYLKGLNEGMNSLDAAEAAFGDIKTLSKELNLYLKRSSMAYLKIPPSKFEIAPVSVREVSEGEDAVMDARIRSRRGVDREQALALLPEMRKAAAPFPNDPAAQAALAEAEHDAGNYKEAEAAADRALAVNPQLGDALIYKARAKMRLAESSADPAVWKDVRRAIAAANKADPEDPEPLILFYESFLAEGLEPTSNAVDGLIYAYELAPHDMGLRMQAASLFLIDGKAEEARIALAPVAYNPHQSPMGDAAKRILAALEEGTPADALKAWRGPADEGAAETGDAGS